MNNEPTNQLESILQSNRGKTIAIVSGKGGSGKTMIAVSLAQGAALSGRKVVLFDADFATAGLTYYLTFREFGNIRTGISDALNDSDNIRSLKEWAPVGTPSGPDNEWISRVRLVSMGDQRRIRSDIDLEAAKSVRELIDSSAELGEIVIIDCRGGIDEQSVSICNMVDEIIVVVETDTTSIRASQHLADALSDRRMKPKIAGFILNKVMDDPTSIAKTVSSLTNMPYLGAVPFDIEATRAYIQGRIPDDNTLFCRHVFSTLPKIMPNFDQYRTISTLFAEEFGSVTLKSPEVKSGGLVIFALSIYISVLYVYFSRLNADYAGLFAEYAPLLVVLIFNIFIIAASSDAIRQTLGRYFKFYNNLVGKILKLFARKFN